MVLKRQDKIRAVEGALQRLGFKVLRVRTVRGASGHEHGFTVMATKQGQLHAIDVFEVVDEFKVLSTQLKHFDTNASSIILYGREATELARRLAHQYRLELKPVKAYLAGD